MSATTKRYAAKKYTHYSHKVSRWQRFRRATGDVAIRYAAVMGAVIVAGGLLISMHASAAPPHTVVEAEAFITSRGSTIHRTGRNHSSSVVEMQAGSFITKQITSYEPISSVMIRAKASNKCDGSWHDVRVQLNGALAGTVRVNSKRLANFEVKTNQPAGDYTVVLTNDMPNSCKAILSVDSVKFYGPKKQKASSDAFVTPTPSPSEQPGDTPSPTPTPSPTATPTPTPTPSSSPTPGSAPTVCPNAPHTPGGPDGFGGCWPYEGNTGVPSGVNLTTYNGPCTITSPTAIDAKTINCDMVIKAPLILTRSVVNGHFEADSGQSLEISDSVIHAGNTTAPGIGYSNLTVRRTEITGGQHSILCSDNCVAEDNWLHDQYNPEGQATHNNAYLSNGGKNHTVRHNSLLCSPPSNTTGGGCTADASFFGDFAAVTNVTIDRNLFMATPSGGYCGTFGYNPTKTYGSTPNIVTVTNNVFQRGGNGGCGVTAPVTSFLTGNGNTWSNNSWDDGATIQAAQ